MVSLVNAARLAAGKSSLGWMNKALYRSYQFYTNDITGGKNNCAGGGVTSCCAEGFNAAVGWDPATGLGSLNFMLFKNFFLSFDNTSPPTMQPTPPSGKFTGPPTNVPTVRPINKLKAQSPSSLTMAIGKGQVQ